MHLEARIGSIAVGESWLAVVNRFQSYLTSEKWTGLHVQMFVVCIGVLGLMVKGRLDVRSHLRPEPPSSRQDRDDISM